MVAAYVLQGLATMGFMAFSVKTALCAFSRWNAAKTLNIQFSARIRAPESSKNVQCFRFATPSCWHMG